jgi:hypothetical protein
MRRRRRRAGTLRAGTARRAVMATRTEPSARACCRARTGAHARDAGSRSCPAKRLTRGTAPRWPTIHRARLTGSSTPTATARRVGRRGVPRRLFRLWNSLARALRRRKPSPKGGVGCDRHASTQEASADASEVSSRGLGAVLPDAGQAPGGWIPGACRAGALGHVRPRRCPRTRFRRSPRSASIRRLPTRGCRRSSPCPR